MREEEHLHNIYRYLPGVYRGKRQPVEDEIERYYTLVHLKLAPSRLRIFSLVNIFSLLGALVVFLIGALLLPKPIESRIEKRELAKPPVFTMQGLLSGELSREVELYFSDTFPMREWFVGLSAVIDESKGVRFDDVRIVVPSAGEQPPQPQPEQPGAAQANDQQNPGQEADSLSPSSAGSEQTNESISMSNGTVIYKGMAMSLFGGSAQNGEWYAEVLNKYKEELPDVQIYNMIIPTQVEFYIPEKYRDMTQSQKNMIDLIYGKLDSSIKRVDAYSALQTHANEYIYFRSDHHWTALGAYYAYTAFCQQAGLSPLSISDFETRRLDDFIGTMYAQSQDSTLLQNPDYVDYYIFDQPYTAQRYDKGSPNYGTPHTLWGEYAVSPNSYSVFLHGDFPMISIQTGINNGRKIMMVKESFGNAFAPFLINHYEEVYIVDQRYFELAAVDFIKEKGINELLFANNAFAVCTPYHIRCIDGMRHHTYYFYTPPKPKEEEVEDEPEEEEPSSSSARSRRESISSASSAGSRPLIKRKHPTDAFGSAEEG